MAYDISFLATDDADWIEAIDLLDDDTNEELADAEDADFELVVTEDGCTVLSASTDDGTITKPASATVTWRFTKDQLGALCAGRTYGVGLTMTTDGDQIVQIISGSLVFKDGAAP